ncbi:PRD domain-containing protein [Clostridium sp. Marseille-P2415]|uniref:PRD domain-containing protein n=1 Tax=Clostridium sp. Marseille-P2415 TaxID=1805471 RepID=UPI000988420B|nr:PRD domain-containing protein [Clostridium sp. Marseille-P2415]
MYRISKILNHNSVIAIDMNDNREYILLGKGIGFGKKVSERFEAAKDCSIYSLQEKSERGTNRELVKNVAPEYFEYANTILDEAEKKFGKLDRSILFPMADHIAFAVQRIQNGEQIYNPLTEDIKALFHCEFKVALVLRDILKSEKNIYIDDDEIGYVSLHIHAAKEDIHTSISMKMAEAVRRCVSIIENEKKCRIDVMSLSYNRLMNHVKYMVARIVKDEELKLNINDYMEFKFPESFTIATTICDELSIALKMDIKEVEIGYLAMHIERIILNEELE